MTTPNNSLNSQFKDSDSKGLKPQSEHNNYGNGVDDVEKQEFVHFEDGESMDDWQENPMVAGLGNSPQITDKVFLPDWNNKPKVLPAVLTLNGSSILTHQNLTSIIAAPGFGKSSICEAILASYLNPDADCLGFKVDPNCRGVIYIDFERTNSDVWNSFSRMCRRAGISEGQGITGVQIAGMRSIPRLDERLSAIEVLLQKYPCSLLILDGAGDMVTDTNDLLQAIECRIFLRELTVRHELSIVTTLHPNPNSTKPRGHIGGEVLRESEVVLLVKKVEGEFRLITSDFEHGKNRNSAPITTGFSWCAESMMFMSIDIEGMAENAKSVKDEQKITMATELAKKILPPLDSMTDGDLLKAIMKLKSASLSTAKRYKSNMVEWDIISKRPDGRYQLVA